MNSKRWAIFGVCVLAAVAARADDWAPPTPRIFATERGSYGFKNLPLDPPFTKSSGILFTLGKDAKEQVLWEQKLVNVPDRVFVAEDGKVVVTVDTYARRGYEHALVLYGAKGKTLADFRLEDLLAAAEIKQHVQATAESRHWSGEANFRFDRSNQFIITLKWGKIIKMALETGKLVNSSFPNKNDSTAKLLKDLEQADDKLGFVCAAAIDLLAERKAKEAIPKLIDLLTDSRALPGSDNWVGGHAANALAAITGRPFSIEQKEWKHWWEKHKGEFTDAKADPQSPKLTARIEVVPHQHCFTVRLFLKNNGDQDVDVVYGRGNSGMSVVPTFHVAGMIITPPQYLRPPRRTMQKNKIPVPVKKEALYGTFTMDYPPLGEEKDTKILARIQFEELNVTLQTEAQALNIPTPKEQK